LNQFVDKEIPDEEVLDISKGQQMKSEAVNERRHAFAKALHNHSLFKQTQNEIAKLKIPFSEGPI